MYTNIFSFHTHDVGLSNSVAQPMKLRCVFNKVFLVNHWHDILNCSYKWLCFNNCYRCIGRKNYFYFPLRRKPLSEAFGEAVFDSSVSEVSCLLAVF